MRRFHIRYVLFAIVTLTFVRGLAAMREGSECTYVEHGDGMLCLRLGDGSTLLVPRDYVLAYDYSEKVFLATLVDGEPLELRDVVDVSSEAVADFLSFSSYKFNNKNNSQLFTDAECAVPNESEITVEVGGIGKWLTASFKFTEDGTTAWVNGVQQRSGKTRQSFASPVTYELTNESWKELKLKQIEGQYAREYADYVNVVTVSVDFLTDHPTGEYGVPRIDILLDDTSAWSGGNWIGMHGKSYYEQATIEIDGAGVYPDMVSSPIFIKGRGNTSWSNNYESKNPYHFKFVNKHKPLGMKSGKHWVLLSNKQTGSMTTNAVGHKICNMLETAGTNHIVPVELYINGSYRGSYDLTEHVGLSNNSVDLDDESCAAMIEMDVVNDEPVYYNNAYGLPAKIHEPDLDKDATTLDSTAILEDFNRMMTSVQTGADSYLRSVDAGYLARYLLANEYMCNLELAHPKSVFLYSENVTDSPRREGDYDETPWVFGPAWDFDWAYGYRNREYFVYSIERDYYETLLTEGTSQGAAGEFFSALRFNSVEVDSIYYGLMYRFMNNGGIDELLDYCDEYYEFVRRSFEHNMANETTERDSTDYSSLTESCKDWLAARAEYVMSTLTPYEVPDDDGDDDDDTPVPHIPAGGAMLLPAEDVIYDLSGRRISRQQASQRHGVYIINGRKVVR